MEGQKEFKRSGEKREEKRWNRRRENIEKGKKRRGRKREEKEKERRGKGLERGKLKKKYSPLGIEPMSLRMVGQLL